MKIKNLYIKNILLVLTSLSFICNIGEYRRYGLNPFIIGKILIKYKPEYFIYIKKKQFKLYLLDSRGEIKKIFPVAIGKKKNFERKIYSGDKGTPEGLYHITRILSENAPKNSYAYKRLKEMNSVYFYAKDGHHRWGNPNADLGRNAYGPAVFYINYPNEEDKKRYEEYKKKGLIPKRGGKFAGIGGGIAIHGTNDPPSIGHCISDGCIRMYNEDLKKLEKFIKKGMPVYIEK